MHVLTPFPHIAAHIIKAQFVRQLLAHGMCPALAVPIIPGDLAYVVAARVCIAFGLIASPACVLPFRIGRQSVFFPRQFVELAYEPLTVVPAYLFHRQVIALHI